MICCIACGGQAPNNKLVNDICEGCQAKELAAFMPTTKQISQLYRTATREGDKELMGICEAALEGHPQAIDEVADILNNPTENTYDHTLATDTYCVGIHSRTGQAIDEGSLPAGTPVRNITQGDSELGPVWRFESLDSGLWFTQEAYKAPLTKEA